MSHLPITRMTLYKHGVGFFERRAHLSGEQIELSFRVEEMNDILKSLTAIDWGQGKVLGIDYATPQSREERLAGCSIRLNDLRSLRDLLVGLRGRRVGLLLDQDERPQGKLLGLDEPNNDQPLNSTLVSLLVEDSNQVCAYPLARLQGVDILDERGADDLRFFLQTSLSQEQYRQVAVRLTPGEHELSVSYIAPAPTWRVSYRLVIDPGEGNQPARALLQGWGIFDNRLEEDLQAIKLSLVAGMPISFVYDLYTPFTPERPLVKEEGRVAAAPVEFDQFTAAKSVMAPMAADGRMMRSMAPMPAPAALGAGFAASEMADAMANAAPVQTSAKDLGELFQYDIQTPVSVGRGQSAMVPILSSFLKHEKDLIYNGQKMPKHPVATMRLKNETGLTLERGPVTVMEAGEYMGEAVLSFTAAEGQIVAPYAVELGVKVKEENQPRIEVHAVRIIDAYLSIEQWDIQQRTYQLNNQTAKGQEVLIEHARNGKYDLFASPEPAETTADHYRFKVSVPAHAEAKLVVQERRLNFRREELRKQTYEGLQRLLKDGLIDKARHEALRELLLAWDRLDDIQKKSTEQEKSREKIYKAQQQIQSNMQALGSAGKEGELRARYVTDLANSEAELKSLTAAENALQAEKEQIENDIRTRIKRL